MDALRTYGQTPVYRAVMAMLDEDVVIGTVLRGLVCKGSFATFQHHRIIVDIHPASVNKHIVTSIDVDGIGGRTFQACSRREYVETEKTHVVGAIDVGGPERRVLKVYVLDGDIVRVTDEDHFRPAEGNELNLKELCYLICRGGWPKAIGKSERAALKQAFNYIDAVAKREIIEVDKVHRSETNTRRLLRSYARHQALQATNGTIAADLKANDGDTLNEATIASYLNALRKIFVIEDMHAWNPNLRSKTAIRTSDTRYYVDPSIATAALGLGPQDLINDLNTMGLFFETLCVRDLRVYADALDGEVYHYRDKLGWNVTPCFIYEMDNMG